VFIFIKLVNQINEKIFVYFFPIIFLGIISAFFDTLSVAMIFPLMNNLINNDSIFNGSILNNSYYIRLNRDSIIFLFFSFFFLKNFLLIYYNYISQKFSHKLYIEASKKILSNKLKEDYLLFHSKTSAEFLRDLRDIPSNLKFYFDCFLSISIEIVTFFLIISFLLIIDFYKTLIVFFFLIFILLIYDFFFKKFPINWGNRRTDVIEKLNNALLQSYNNYIEIRIFNKVNFFTDTFHKYNNIFSNITTKINFFSTINKHIIEGVIILCVFFLYLFFKTKIEFVEIIPLLALYGFSFLRLLPSINKILTLRNSIKSQNSVLNIVDKILDQNFNKIEDIKNFDKFNDQIEFKNISYKYPNSNNYIINNLSFIIKKNSFFGIKGQSGVGKSTLCKLLIAMVKKTQGQVLVDGNKLEDILNSFRKKIAYVSQNFYMLNDTIYKNITLSEEKNKASLELYYEAIHLSLCDIFLDKLPYKEDSIINENANNLSGGQRQRLCIARALFKKPEILILDEATSSLDSEIESNIIENLKKIKNKITIIMISHNLKTLSYCDQVLDLDNLKNVRADSIIF